MTIPTLKRIKVSSEQELRGWLTKNGNEGQSVMLVTYCDTTHPKHVSRDQVQSAALVHGWTVGRRYTLSGDLLGHVLLPA